jgi:hypothetical protein
VHASAAHVHGFEEHDCSNVVHDQDIINVVHDQDIINVVHDQDIINVVHDQDIAWQCFAMDLHHDLAMIMLCNAMDMYAFPNWENAPM